MRVSLRVARPRRSVTGLVPGCAPLGPNWCDRLAIVINQRVDRLAHGHANSSNHAFCLTWCAARRTSLQPARNPTGASGLRSHCGASGHLGTSVTAETIDAGRPVLSCGRLGPDWSSAKTYGSPRKPRWIPYLDPRPFDPPGISRCRVRASRRYRKHHQVQAISRRRIRWQK